MPILQFHLPDTSTTTFELPNTERLTIGAASDNDLQVTDPSISRAHAELLQSGGEYRIKDLGSTNKTWINNVAIVDVPLKENIHIRLGHVEGRFIKDEPTSAAGARGTAPDALPPLAILTLSGPSGGAAANAPITHRFRSTRLTVGWKSHNLIQLKDPSVSGQHAEITFEKGVYRVKDLDSSNHTFLNGKEITEAELKSGDVLSFGALETTFTLPSSPTVAKAPTPVSAPTPPSAPKIPVALKAEVKLPVPVSAPAAPKPVTAPITEPISIAKPAEAEKAAPVADLKREKEQQAEIQRLSQENASLQNALQELNAKRAADVEAHTKQSAASLKELENASARFTTLAQEHTQLQATVEAEQQKAQETAKQLAERAEVLQKLEKQQAETTTQLAESAAKLAETKGKLTEAEEKTALAEAKVTAQADEHAKLLLQKEDAHNASHAALNTALTEAQAEAAKATEALLAAKATAEAAAATSSEATEKELAAAKQTVEAIEKERDTAASEVARLTKELAEATATPTSSAELEKAREEIAALTKQRESADLEAATLAAKLDDEHQQTEAIATANTQLQSECDTLGARLKETDKRLHTLTHERDTAQKNVIELEHQLAALLAEAKDAPPKKKSASAPPAPVKQSPPPTLKKRPSSATVKLETNPATLKSLIEEAPQALSSMRKLLHTFIKNQRETSLLDQLLASLQGLTIQSDKAQLAGAVTMTRAIEALVSELIDSPSQITSSSLRSISQSLDFLGTLFEEKNITRIQGPLTANIFAVDDDPDARKIIRAAMEVIQLKITCADDPQATLAALNEQVFDLIFVDVGLPEMNGFELCTKIRSLPQHRKTPVVFLTGAVTVQNRVQSSLSGGNDFIAKPFNILELGVKALTWILKGQLGLP